VALRPGFGAFHGVAQPLDARPGGLLVRTTLTQVRTTRGWRDVDRASTGSLFALVLDTGEEIEIDPRDVRFPEVEAVERSREGFTRKVAARLSAGDDVWATGILPRRRKQGTGAYRSVVARRRLVAPRRGHVELLGASPLPLWSALAAAHRTGAYLVAAALVLPNVCIGVLAAHPEVVTPRGEQKVLEMMLLVSTVALTLAVSSWRRRVLAARKGALG
jgi:hypothetical protein